MNCELDKKLLVLFVFHEYNDRVELFFKNAIFNDKNTDFIIIANNIDFKFNNDDFPSNVSFLNRDNIGYDFGGWSDALLTNKLYQNYDNFIFVNSSVIGPFMGNYPQCKWTDIYINGLLTNNIKLFGSTINTCMKPYSTSHVQSYIFSMDKITLEYLISCEIFSMSNYAKTFQDAINLKEILMSRKIIENNWNIGSLMNYYKDVDFTFKTKKAEDYKFAFLDCILNNRFINKLWTPDELVFIKGNRGIKLGRHHIKVIKK